jgi:hypothetical protein
VGREYDLIKTRLSFRQQFLSKSKLNRRLQMQLSNRNMKRVLFVLLIVSMMIFATQPFAASAQSFVGATSANGGASTASATTFGAISTASAASIGNASAFGLAFTPVSAAGAGVATTGPAAAYASAYGVPGFSTANVWTASLPGGTAIGTAFAMP